MGWKLELWIRYRSVRPPPPRFYSAVEIRKIDLLRNNRSYNPKEFEPSQGCNERNELLLERKIAFVAASRTAIDGEEFRTRGRRTSARGRSTRSRTRKGHRVDVNFVKIPRSHNSIRASSANGKRASESSYVSGKIPPSTRERERTRSI